MVMSKWANEVTIFPLKLLMVQKSGNHHLGCIKLVNKGINHQPQLVQDFFHQQYDEQMSNKGGGWVPTQPIWISPKTRMTSLSHKLAMGFFKNV